MTQRRNTAMDLRSKNCCEQGDQILPKLIVGCGYVGQRLAEAWHANGETVYATTRSDERAKCLADSGYQPIVWDITKPPEAELPNVETVVFAVGFDRHSAKASGQSIEDVYVRGLERVLHHCSSAAKWIYLSSTGVYGQTDGSWVDEDSPCTPNRDGGKACLAAEQLLASHPIHGQQSVILRLAGIYGPDRLPQAKTLERNEPLAVAAKAYLNLIHVDDIVSIIQSCEAITTPNVLCVSDGHPIARAEFYEYLAQLLGTPPPWFEPPEPGTSRAERARGSKRVRNDKLLASIQPTFRYPTYREGLKSIVLE